MNIKKYYLFKLLYDLMPIYPIYILLFQSKNMTMNQISLLLIIWSAAAVIMEVPTGLMADHWNRRNLLVIGAVLKACGYISWIISNGFILYALGFILWGIGGAMQSGSEEALLFDMLKADGREDRFDQILGRGHFLSGIGNILAALTGGIIGERFGFRTALYLSVLFSLFAAGIVAGCREVNLFKQHREKQRNKAEKGTLRNSFVFLLKNRELFLLSLLVLFTITTAGALDEYDQLIAKEYGLTVKWIGIWAAVRFILISLGGYLARGVRIGTERLLHTKDRMYTVSFLCSVAAVLLVLSGAVKQIGIMSLYGLYYLIMSVCDVLQEDYLQQQISTQGRATIHSLFSLTQNLYGMLCYMLISFTAVKAGLLTGLIWIGAYIIICCMVILLLYKRCRKVRKNELSCRASR